MQCILSLYTLNNPLSFTLFYEIFLMDALKFVSVKMIRIIMILHTGFRTFNYLLIYPIESNM